MLTALSIENKLKQWLTMRGMSTDAFAALVKMDGVLGCSETRLRQAFSGRCLEGPLAARLWELRNEIEDLCRAFEPFALDLSDGARVFDWLKARRTKSVYSVVLIGLEPTEGQ